MGINSKVDTTIAGANLMGGDVLMNVGRDLNLISRRDMSNSASRQYGIDASVTVTYGAVGGSINANAAASQSYSDFVGQQTSIIGVNSVDVTVGKHTDITGGAMVALNDNLKLDTGSLSYKHMYGNSSESGFKVGGGFEWEMKAEGGSLSAGNVESPSQDFTLGKVNFVKPKVGALGLTMYNQSQDVLATVGKGEIIVRDNPGQKLDGLNRDPSIAFTKGDKTGFSIDIASPQDIANTVEGFFNIKTGFDVFTWTPEVERNQILENGLKAAVKEGKISQEEFNMAQNKGSFLELYVKSGINIPEDISNVVNTFVPNNGAMPDKWEYTIHKAQINYDKRVIDIPGVGWFFPGK